MCRRLTPSAVGTDRAALLQGACTPLWAITVEDTEEGPHAKVCLWDLAGGFLTGTWVSGLQGQHRCCWSTRSATAGVNVWQGLTWPGRRFAHPEPVRGGSVRATACACNHTRSHVRLCKGELYHLGICCRRMPRNL